MANRVRTLTGLFSRYGAGKTLAVASLWLARQAIGYRKAFIYRLNLDNLAPLPGCPAADWNYRTAAELDAPILEALGDDPEAPAPFSSHFVGTIEGAQCFVSALSRDGFSVPDRAKIAFTANTASYVGACLTLPRFRGMNLYPCALVQLGLRLRQEGKQHLYLFVEADNLASIRGVLKAGFIPVAACSVFYLRKKAFRRWRFLRTAEPPRDLDVHLQPTR